MIRIRKILSGIIIISLIGAISLCSGCTEEEKTPVRHTTAAETEGPITLTGVLDNIEDGKITLYRTEDGDKISLRYDGATYFRSASGTAIATAQLETGTVLEMTYTRSDSLVSECRITDDKEIWHNTKVTSFAVDETTNSMKIGTSLYAYTDATKVYSEGELIDIQELNAASDQLEVWGNETTILSVIVNKGHGYLSLSGDDLFTGGLITIGDILVHNIEDNMLLTVTEGTYSVQFQQGEYDVTKEVTITRGEETKVDLSDVPAIFDATGNVSFTINPSSATLLVDGTEYDPDDILSLTVGSHTATVSATGYESETHTFTVAAGFQEFEIDLTVTGDEEATTASEEETTVTEITAVSESTEATSAEDESGAEEDESYDTETTSGVESDTKVSTINNVSVTGPEGASIYFDSTYMGAAPVTFALVTGNHIITVVDGSSVRSYSVNLAEGGDDVSYDFSDKE